jgi:hypothetical protein
MRICQVIDSLCGLISKKQFKDYIQESYIGFLSHA